MIENKNNLLVIFDTKAARSVRNMLGVLCDNAFYAFDNGKHARGPCVRAVEDWKKTECFKRNLSPLTINEDKKIYFEITTDNEFALTCGPDYDPSESEQAIFDLCRCLVRRAFCNGVCNESRAKPLVLFEPTAKIDEACNLSCVRAALRAIASSVVVFASEKNVCAAQKAFVGFEVCRI